MKLIEALKQIKVEQKKAGDLRQLVRDNCAISSLETPKYVEQDKKIKGWIQAHSDILKEIERLRTAIQRTNLATKVTIELDGKKITKTIAEWIHRRRDLATEECTMWNMLTDRRIVEGPVKGPAGDVINIAIIRYYEPEKRDKMRELFSNEPTLIDAKLEIVNAVTDLIEK